MSTKTAIEWTEATWNPVTGCDQVSPGCDHCYALTLAGRLKAMGNRRYQVDGNPKTSGPGFGVTLHPDKLEEPLRWKRPRMVFVNSMSDLFHKAIPTEYIERVFEAMCFAEQHTFQILTKRPGRMASFMRKWTGEGEIWKRPPPRNVWLGTSVENDRWACVRLPKLVETPAAIRFLSCEPLLGPVELRGWLGLEFDTMAPKDAPLVDWVIVGGESGGHARPMWPDWAWQIRDACVAAGVPFFFKQWGGPTSKAGGRHLDGRLWDEMPTKTSLARGDQ